MAITAPRIIRPLQLSFTHRVLEQDRRFHLIASATLGIRLDTGAPCLDFEYLEPALAAMGARPAPDPGMPKPNGEYLVSGSFFAPGGEPVTGHEVAVRLGQLEKRLVAFGPRRWGPLLPGAPEPVTSLPLDAEHAFGGPGFAANPAGMGFQDGRLPCVEDPRRLIAGPGDRPEPAGFAPLDATHPRRMRFQPAYGEDYLRRYYPGLPQGFDWRYFLCAPEDQWLPGFFQGDEPFELRHLHPQAALLQGRLPGLRARCFLGQGRPPELAELPMNLDTVWFFPDRMLALLIWRGGLEVADDEASQVSHYLLAYEDQTQPARDLEHYRRALARRLPDADPLLNGLNTEDLIPQGAPCAMELLQARAQTGQKGAFARNLEAKVAALKALVEEKTGTALADAEQRMAGAALPEAARADPRAAFRAAGRDVPADAQLDALKQTLGSILPGLDTGDPAQVQLKHFSFDQLGQLAGAATDFSRGQEAKARTELDRVRRDVAAQVRRQGEGQAGPELREGLAGTLERLEQPTPAPLAPLPRLPAEDLVARLAAVSPGIAEALDQLKAAAEDPAEAERLAGSAQRELESAAPGFAEALRGAERHFKEAYRMGAHRMGQGLAPQPEPPDQVRERFLRAVAGGRPVAQGDWACIDLSDQNLDGLDLTGAYLEQVDFHGASLRGANLSGAILARANLEGADLSLANLEGANAGAVRAAGARFAGANLKAAQLSRGEFTGADFRGCDLQGAQTLEIRADQADFSEARLAGARFLDFALTGTCFAGADLVKASFLQGTLAQVVFSGADLRRASWIDVRLDRVRFDRADLRGACFVATDPERSALIEARFDGARLDQSNFQNAMMPAANLDGASLANANFAGAGLAGATLRGAKARGAQFRKAVLTGADLAGIDLMEGSLAKAHLAGASFRDANLFAVDFLRCALGGTDFRGANLERTLIADWRPE